MTTRASQNGKWLVVVLLVACIAWLAMSRHIERDLTPLLARWPHWVLLLNFILAPLLAAIALLRGPIPLRYRVVLYIPFLISLLLVCSSAGAYLFWAFADIVAIGVEAFWIIPQINKRRTA